MQAGARHRVTILQTAGVFQRVRVSARETGVHILVVIGRDRHVRPPNEERVGHRRGRRVTSRPRHRRLRGRRQPGPVRESIDIGWYRDLDVDLYRLIRRQLAGADRLVAPSRAAVQTHLHVEPVLVPPGQVESILVVAGVGQRVRVQDRRHAGHARGEHTVRGQRHVHVLVDDDGIGDDPVILQAAILSIGGDDECAGEQVAKPAGSGRDGERDVERRRRVPVRQHGRHVIGGRRRHRHRTDVV